MIRRNLGWLIKKRDTFYGKKQMTAVREYLEMRRAQGDGPATPREIYDALKAGGYTFSSKSDHIALVTIRALLRKATTVFHKLPGTGTYGLAAWYPDAKGTKAATEGAYGPVPRKGAKTTLRKAKRKFKRSPLEEKRAPDQPDAADPNAALEST